MPFAKIFDPLQTTYAELLMNSIDVIICLSYQSECQHKTGGTDLLAKYGKDGFAVLYFPIDDFKTPPQEDSDKFSHLVDRLESFLAKGLNVYIHCHAGIGR